MNKLAINLDLFKRTLLIQSLADALGYHVEFKTFSEIQSVYKEKGLTFTVAQKASLPLLITDDTQMSLFAIEGLYHCFKDGVFTYDQQNIMNAYLNWFSTQKSNSHKTTESLLLTKPFLFYQRAPGNTCLSSLATIDSETKNIVYNTSHCINSSKGCGGIMRAMPFVFFSTTPEEAWEYGCQQAAITHGHPLGYQSSGFYCLVAFYVMRDNLPVSKAYYQAKSFYKKNVSNQILTDYLAILDDAINDYFSHSIVYENEKLNRKLLLGWTAEEALIISIYCAIVANTFEEVIEIAINHDGDSDSTAVLAAGLYQLARPTENFNKYYHLMPEHNDINEVLNDFMFKIQTELQKQNNS